MNQVARLVVQKIMDNARYFNCTAFAERSVTESFNDCSSGRLSALKCAVLPLILFMRILITLPLITQQTGVMVAFQTYIRKRPYSNHGQHITFEFSRYLPLPKGIFRCGLQQPFFSLSHPSQFIIDNIESEKLTFSVKNQKETHQHTCAVHRCTHGIYVVGSIYHYRVRQLVVRLGTRSQLQLSATVLSDTLRVFVQCDYRCKW